VSAVIAPAGRRDRFLSFPLCVEHRPAGVTERITLFVQTSNDAAAAGRGTAAIFVIIRLAGGALLGCQGLRQGRAGK